MSPELISHWQNLIHAAGFTTTSLSEKVATRTTLGKILKENGPKPNIELIMKVADHLGVSLDYLMMRENRISVSSDLNYRKAVNKSAERILHDVMAAAHIRLRSTVERGLQSGDPNLEANYILPTLLGWWHQQNGLLTQADQLQEHFDLVRAPNPDDATVEVIRMGQESLAAQKLKTNCPDALNQLVQTFTPDARAEIVRSYYSASQSRQPVLSAPIRVSIPKPLVDNPIEVDFFRLQLPVQAGTGERFVINYSFTV